MKRLGQHLLCGLLLLAFASANADERRKGGTDTKRHPSRPSAALNAPRQSNVFQLQPRGEPGLKRTDPAARQYWSDKCLQQRERGWGHTPDCDSPAYTGGHARAHRPDRYRRQERDWPRVRHRGHVIIERPGGRFSSGSMR